MKRLLPRAALGILSWYLVALPLAGQGQTKAIPGDSYRPWLERIDHIMAAHPADLGPALQADEALRNELVGLHHKLYSFCRDSARTPEARQPLRQWLVAHIAKFPQYLRRQHLDPKQQPFVPSLAYQTWTTLMLLPEGDPDALPYRGFVADTIGFRGRLRDILVEFGTLIIENGSCTTNQQQTLYSYLSQIPKPLLGDRQVGRITEVITLGEYLGPGLDVRHEGGVNIFANESGRKGSSENPFPKDFPGMENDYFGLVLAHELNHRVDATRFALLPKYNQKYWDHMQKACGDDVKFRQPTAHGVDWDATKKHFQARGWWNGIATDWDKAWIAYWHTEAGAARNRNVCRNHVTYMRGKEGIPFFLETRQESIASLANQYFTDSRHMFEYALDRCRRGAPGCLDEWLLMADVYAMDGDCTLLYKHANGDVNLTRRPAPLRRNAQGQITAVTIDGHTYEFDLDKQGLVDRIRP
ncbi:MAG: hypothetical protein NTV49_09340 [Kiritimatiellaeota bacterium]|nr:hypothetical protein [Kiritimatiellota bacterium]